MKHIGEINGYIIYKNEKEGHIVAYYPDFEQLIFEDVNDFYKWFDFEMQE